MYAPKEGQVIHLGRMYMTASALARLDPEDVFASLSRHALGDWGEMDEEDRHLNDVAVLEGGRILSSYRDKTGEPFWIITEADRSATTVLLPEDY